MTDRDPHQAADALAIGSVLLDRYRLTDLLGRGAAGEVHRGVDLKTGELVAVKTMAPSIADRVDWVKRFRREAKVLSQIDHPHSVRFVGHGHTADGVAVLVMECLDGEDLFRALRRRNRFSLQTTLELTLQILGALAHAHGKGILHRDLKPSNIYLLQPQAAVPYVKLIDFGLAKVEDDGSLERLTREGAIIGTPAYMSPEQCMGQSLTAASDLYAVGVLLYEMLSGRAPYESPKAMGLLTQHMYAPLPIIAQARPDLADPEPIQGLINTLMAKHPSARPASAKAAIALVEGVLRHLQARHAEHESTAVATPALSDEAADDRYPGSRDGHGEARLPRYAISHEDEGPAPSALDSLVEAGAQAVPMPNVRAAMDAAARRAKPAEPRPSAPASPAPMPAQPREISGAMAAVGDDATSTTRAANPMRATGVRPASGGFTDRRMPRGAVSIAGLSLRLQVDVVVIRPAGASGEIAVRAAIWMDSGRPPITVPLNGGGGRYRGDATLARPTAQGLTMSLELEAPIGSRFSVSIQSLVPAPQVLAQREGAATEALSSVRLPLG